MNFSKLHGLGNNFILADNRNNEVSSPNELAKTLCSVNFGIGADGLILVEKPTLPDSDYAMRIYNSDGSEPEMCGNGIRCFAKYLHDKGISTKETLNVDTLAGKKITTLVKNDALTSSVRVDMGEPSFASKDFTGSGQQTFQAEGRDFYFVSMGNPHAITFVDNFDFDYHSLGKKMENNLSLFPHRSNIEFIHIKNDHEISMRVWERGCGETMACGTGACASVVAAIQTGKVRRGKVSVHLLGGDLEIDWAADGHIYMTGPAVHVFDGTYNT
jgi:diaminopimelate epimerase